MSADDGRRIVDHAEGLPAQGIEGLPGVVAGAAPAQEEPPDWPELEVAPPAPARPSVRRPAWLLVAVAILVINGFGGIVNAVLTPFLPEALANVAPVLAGIIGLGGLAAALGVWRMTEWGRLLGLGVALGWLLRDALLAQAALALGIDPLLGRTPSPLFDWILPLTLDVIVLGTLALSWPRTTQPD